MKKNNIIFILFMIGLLLIEIGNFCQNISFFSLNFLYRLMDISFAFLSVSAFLTLVELKPTFKQCVLVFIVISISLLCTLHTHDNFFIQLSLFTIASLKLDFKKIIKVDLIYKILILIFVVLCYYTGNVINTVFIRNNVVRYSFGFTNPNSFSFVMMFIYFEIIYLKNYQINKKNFIKVILMTFILMYIFSFSESRSCEITVLIFLVLYTLYLVFKKTPKIKNSLNFFSNNTGFIIFSIFTLLSLYLCYHLNLENVKALDKTLSGRITIPNYYLSMYNINLFGRKIVYVESIDNSYIRVLLNYGLFGWLLFSYIFNSIMRKCKNELYLKFIFLSLLFYGLMEWFLIRPGINVFLLYFSSTIVKRKLEKGEINE